ncbi:type IV pilus modification PilV family protein [Candidatus Lucifugimonas marina]|uniref:Prepilin-type N-terminal cleavage/methylation domain-containing protein n=1 Tax=Candidatus Lucifugimonas marina TaxID=3038979 RepID=A0AAJ5ZCL2_9CHLR|nr:prepilin-type N-terminal cleavage/methylation domain-containing protein [SAR202 cluster bacterium JH702]MDG0868297.1 prepilin-type N-terminal cleavage/methylation domain-containing protein [SAR202 cluster bacterium JH639]WFG34941.1 prepilin-type N-terminal cleavage/methylation domain-containing protein [SAR202 cluster bacterium JH545]WFG38892.1 prepilin-type N-terminal cleavage/methylation domain-containing protein [SAR202 cluster bacterium JH1073]
MSLPSLSIRTPRASRSIGEHADYERGFVMIEMMLAVAIVGTAMLAVVMAFSSASKTAGFVDSSATGQWLSTSQMELVRAATFVPTPGTYANVTAPAGFVVTNATSAVTGGDANIQIVSVTITEDGETIFEASTMKVNR